MKPGLFEMKGWRPNLRARLLLGAVLPALFMVTLLEVVFLVRYQADIEKSFLDNGRAIARQLEPAIEYALFTGSTPTLRALAESTRQSDARIMSVSVLDPDGELLANAGLPLHADLSLDSAGQHVHEGTASTIVVTPIAQVVLAATDDIGLWESVAAAAPGISGYVVIELSHAQLTERQAEMLRITVAIMLSGLLLASWLSLRVASHVFAELDAAATELRRQKEMAEALARTDALTGLANRRAFDETALREIERARRYGTPLSLLMADLDHFKAINDNFGHHFGDQVLKDFAGIMASSVRGVDLVGRWGGEEFAILLPGTMLAEAVQAAERMRLAAAGAPTRLDGKTCGYTASFGVAELLPDDPTLDGLLGRADGALYRAKDSGRNRVVTA